MTSPTSFQQDPNAILDYTFDWSLWITSGDTIGAVTFTAQSGLTLEDIRTLRASSQPVIIGGSFSASTYYWVITAYNANGETTRSNEVSATLTGSTSSVPLAWVGVPGAAGYKLYRGTSTGVESNRIATITGGSNVTYTDTGTSGTSASPPGSNTASGGGFTSTSAIAWIGGGTAGTPYTLSSQITTAAGRQDVRSIIINIEDM